MKRHVQKACAVFLALTLLLSFSATGCKKKSTLPTDANGKPYISEKFGEDKKYYIEKETVSLSVVDTPGETDNKSILISGRGSNNAGIAFPCNEFIGNTISTKVRVMSSNPTVRTSLQYDVYGNTTYVTIASMSTNADSYRYSEGTVEIPDQATNVSVFIEADDVKDIYVDSVDITVSGDYVDPSTIKSVKIASTSEYSSLKELYQDYFKMGVALPKSIVSNENSAFIDLVSNQFNSITMENEMKPENLIDSATTLANVEQYNECPAFDFSQAEETIAYAEENGISMRGHTLIWYSQTPSWLFYENYDVNGNLASRELMLTRMENYIKTVLEYYQTNHPGLFYAWDVVNEAAGDGTPMRDCYWLQTIGEDYVEQAFAFARKYADSDVQLFYNDYNEYQESKQDAIIEFLTPIAEAGNIDGMGMQCHIDTGLTPSVFVDSMNRYAEELGVSIHITELDISAPATQNPQYDQGRYFKRFFEALIEAKNAGTPLECVTIWGLTDDFSWKSSDTPLLFRGNLEKKSAFEGVVCAVTGDEIPLPDDYVEVVLDLTPIYEDFEDGTFIGSGRYSATQTVVGDSPYEGAKCLCNAGGDASYDGYAIDVTRFLGQTISFSFAIKTEAPSACFTADINGEWPHLSEIDTSSGEWIYIEGTYDVPSTLTFLQLYFESSDMSEVYLDNISITAAE